MGVSPHLRRYMTSLAIAIVFFAALIVAVTLGMPMPRVGHHAHWYRDPLTWLLVGAATIVVGIVQRRRRR